MIAAVHFQNFKALRSAALKLEPFNLVIGPNGSGKTSLIQSLLRLRTLSALPAVQAHELKGPQPAGPQIAFHFHPPYQNVRVTLGCNTDELVCNLLIVDHAPDLEGAKAWGELRTQLQSIRAYLFDHYAIAAPAKKSEPAELASNAGNLAAVLANWQDHHPESYRALENEFRRLVPEFRALELTEPSAGYVELGARLVEGNELVRAESMSQGMLYLLATLALSFAPQPPAVVCIEEADRGVHPRTLREIRDALYRLSYPKDFGLARAPAQVITTTHSPYLLDLFKNHPEEVVLAQKHGRAATFERLSERADLRDLLQEAQLGDLWYSGILGGVPGVE